MTDDTTHAETFESGIAVLAEDEPTWEDGPFPVRGVALTEDITPNSAKTENLDSDDEPIETFWPADVVASAAEAFVGAKIVDGSEHDPKTVLENLQPAPDTIVGEITHAEHKPGVGVLYEGEVDDPEIAKRIDRGRVDVSPTIYRTLADDPDDQGRYPVAEVLAVRDLSIVADGSVDGNSIEPAAQAATAMAAEVLEATFGAETFKTVAGVSFDGTATGSLDESDIPNDDFDGHYLFDGDTKSESSYPVVDADGNLRRGNVESAFELGARGGVGEAELHSKLAALNDEFDDPPIDPDKLSGETMGAESPADGTTGGDDGPDGPSTDGPADSHPTMSDLTDDEKALIETADDPAAAAEVLREYARFDEPTIREQTDVEALREDLDDAKQVFAEALADQTGMQAETLASLDWSALRGEFEDDDGDLDAETLFQQPEGGSANTGGGGDGGLDDEDRDRIQEIDRKLELLGTALPRERKADLRAEACKLADVENYADVQAEVL